MAFLVIRMAFLDIRMALSYLFFYKPNLISDALPFARKLSGVETSGLKKQPDVSPKTSRWEVSFANEWYSFSFFLN